MISDPDGGYELQAALRSRLLAAPAVAALVAGRIFDQPPQSIAYPWIELGQTQDLPFEDGGCINGLEYWLTLHIWARSQKAASEAKAINKAVKAALHNQILALDGHKLQSMRVTSAFVMKDPDGITRHGVITVNAYTTAL